VGTRDRIISYLGTVPDISDPGGMASTKLAEAVGYPGSSVAFAQLLSGMERDGLIAREVRGKRTYRIILAPGVEAGRAQATRGTVAGSSAAGSAISGPAEVTGSVISPRAGDKAQAAVPAVVGLQASGAPGFDYDELARRLLLQVIRRLATPAEGQQVADLERELDAALTRASTLTAENRKLREQLNLVSRSLDQAQRSLGRNDAGGAGWDNPDLELAERTRTGQVADELSDADVVLLERLVSPAREAVPDAEDVRPDATASLRHSRG